MKWYLGSVFLAIVLGFQTGYAQYYGNVGFGSESFTYAKALELLQKNQPSTVASALKLFKAKHPDYFHYYTLVYNSFSLQRASFESPRALVFGRDARMVMAFNTPGHGKTPIAGSDNLEIMHFNGKTDSFVFHQIIFRDDHHLADEPYPSHKPYIIAPPNSTLQVQGMCLDCHGVDPRPNWDAYPFWPGVYGSIDDFDDPNMPHMLETREFQTFMRTLPGRSRYSVLSAQNSAPRPNHDFGIMLTWLNSKRVLNRLLHNPKAMLRKYAILHAMACDPPVSERTISNSPGGDDPLMVEVPARPLTPLEKQVSDAIATNLAFKMERIAQLNHYSLLPLLDPFSAYGLKQAAAVFGIPANRPALAYAYSNMGFREALAVAELEKILKPLGFDIGTWTLPFGEISDVFNEPSSNAINIPLRLIYAQPFLNAAFSGPKDHVIYTEFTKWVKFRDGTEVMPPSYRTDCNHLLVLDAKQVRENR